MSWSINAIGTRAAIKAKIDASPYFPDVLKVAAKAVIDENTAVPGKLIHFESFGHVGGGSGSVGKFRVEGIDLAEEPTPAPVVAAPAPERDPVVEQAIK